MTAAPTGLATTALLTPFRARVKWDLPTGGPTTATLLFNTLPTITAVSGSDQPTIVAYADATGGTTNAIQNADLGDGTSTWYEYQINTGAGSVDFRYEVSSEANYDRAYIAVDGAYAVNGASGFPGWATGSVTVTPGVHTVRVTFNKDSSSSQGFDNIRVGKVTYPAPPPTAEYRIDGGTPVTGAISPVTLNGLAPASSRLFEVRHDDGSGMSAWSGLTVTTLAAGPYVETFDTDPFGGYGVVQTAVPITATDQSGYYQSAYSGAQAFDKTAPGNPYISNSGGGSNFWIQVRYASAWVLKSYGLVGSAAYLFRMPSAWIVQGSNDGATWTTIDSRTGQPFPDATTRVFAVAPGLQAAYSYYRLTASASQSGNDGYAEVQEMFMYVNDPAATPQPARVVVNGGSWSWDNTNFALQQTTGDGNARYAFMSAMPRSAANFIDFSADVTLVTDTQARRHLGFFIQSVDGTAATGYRLVALDGNYYVSRFLNGSSQQDFNGNPTAAPPLWASGELRTLRFRKTAAGVCTFWVDGVVIATFTDTTPGFESLRPGFFQWGSIGRFDNLSYDDGVDLTVLSVANLQATTFNGGAYLTWTAMAGASSYQYRINGGAPVAVTSTKATITGLTNGTAYNIEVRAANPIQFSQWRSISVTPTNAILFDNFDRADVSPTTTALGTTPDGKAWNQQGSLGILGGLLYAAGTGENLAWVAGVYDVDLTIVIPTAQSANPDVAVIWRFKDVNNYWMLQYSNNALNLYRRQAGNFVLMAQYGYTWSQNRTDIKMRICAVGSTQRFFIDGVLRFSFEDLISDSSTDTGVGLRDSNAAARVDLISAVAATVPTPIQTHVYKGRDTKTLDSVGAA